MEQLSSVNKCSCGKDGMNKGKEDAIGRAITLRSLSPKTYKWEKYTLPLPSMTTLNRWAAKLNAEPGILNSILSLLGSKSDSMQEIERLSVMSFDETSLSYEWTYDKGKDILYDPNKKVQ